MDELKGCFWWVIAIIGWFVLWGACMSIGDSANISPFVILLIIVGIIVVVGGGGWLIFYRLKSVKEKKIIEKANVIKAKFPLAYQQYTKELKHEKGRFNPISEIEIAKKITTRSIEEWRNEEERIKSVEEKRKEIAKKSATIAAKYPHGLNKWKQEYKFTSPEAIISQKNIIRQYEEYYKTACKFDEWEKEQSEFSKKCRELGPKLMPHFGYYKYNIPFQKNNDSGEIVGGEYTVWQFFAGSYCQEDDLDYTNLEYIKNNNRNIEEFKKGKQYYLPSVYEGIKDFIIKLAENNNVSIYLCANNKEWNAINLNYHYYMVEGAFFYDLPESIEVFDPATDALLFDVDVDPYEYPKLKNKHIIIVEAQTDNSHLEEVCKNVIEKNKNGHPLITYISFFKGYDRKEMMELIEKKNKEKVEEERKKEEERQLILKKQEIENSIKGLPTLVESNNIEQIESKIEYINDNIDLVTIESKYEFEQIKIDYKTKKGIGIPQKEEILYVNYNIPKTKDDGYYAIVRTPEKGSIVWPYRRRTIARRGFTESDFEKALNKYLTPNVRVLGDVNILPQDGVRPYEPDVALIYSENGLNVRIDIEIDEPYAAVTNKPTHYIGCGDDYRDANLNNLGWIVIRFSEHQVFQQTLESVKYVAEIINSIDNTFNISNLKDIPALVSEKQWSKIECQKMAAERYRQLYLKHEFGRTEETVYNIKDLKLTSFETSILDKVKPTRISQPLHKPAIIEDDYENDNNILYNKSNAFEQDCHITFDATQHIYTIDGIQYRSVSSVISDLFPEFDTEKWAEIKACERGVPTQKVIEEWDSKGRQSREVGTFMHQQIENYFLEKPINYEYHYTYDGIYVQEDTVIDIYYEIELFEEFREDVPVIPFRSEWRIFDRSLKLAGTIDLISKNEDGSYNIYDWKRSSRLNNENRYQRGLGKLAHLEDTPRNHYYLQQNLYRYILEHQYGLNIREMKLVGLYGPLDVIDVPKMDNELSIIIQML